MTQPTVARVITASDPKIHCRVDGALHILCLTDVADHSQTFTARGLYLGDGGVHGAGQFRVRFRRLGEQHDVGAPLRN